MSRLETVSTITSQDTQVIGEVTSFRQEIQQRQKRLETARADQAAAVATRAAERSRITGTLRQRQSLLGSIRGEIAHLRAAEQARQLMMAREAQARVSVSSDPVIPDAGAAVASSSEPSLAPPSQYGGAAGIACCWRTCLTRS